MTYTREDSGLIVYSASSIGYCSQALYRDRQGITHEPPPAKLQTAYNEGHDNEPRILALLEREQVWHVVDEQELSFLGFKFGEYDEGRQQDYSKQVRVEKKIGANIVLRAHLDSVVRLVTVPPLYEGVFDVGQLAVGEAKAFGDSFFNAYKRAPDLSSMPQYAWQVSAQMHLTGLPLILLVGKKNKDGVVDYIEHRLFTEAPISWGKIVAKVSRIEGCVNGFEVPNCEIPLMYPCPFWPYHSKLESANDPGVHIGQQQTDAIEVVDGDRGKVIDTLIEKYQNGKRMAKNYNDEADDAKKALMNYVDNSDAPMLATENWVINKTVTPRKGYTVADGEVVKLNIVKKEGSS